MTKILIVEDNTEINRLIADYLSAQGYTVITVFKGTDAVKILKMNTDIDLILLDLMLPFQSGDRILQEIRTFSDVPVIVVSAKDIIQVKVDLIRMGADDYITKPFDLDELLARIEAVLRRNGKTETIAPLVFRDLSLFPQSKVIILKGHPLDLTATEYGILELLLQNPKKLFSKANLFESVWKEPYMGDENTVKVHISNIRNKIKVYSDDEYIETIWGMGYRLKF